MAITDIMAIMAITDIKAITGSTGIRANCSQYILILPIEKCMSL